MKVDLEIVLLFITATVVEFCLMGMMVKNPSYLLLGILSIIGGFTFCLVVYKMYN